VRRALALLAFVVACGDNGPTVNCTAVDVATFVTVTVIDHATLMPNATGVTGTLVVGSKTFDLQPIPFRPGSGTLGVMNPPAGEFDLMLTRNGSTMFRQTGTLIGGVCGGAGLDLAVWF